MDDTTTCETLTVPARFWHHHAGRVDDPGRLVHWTAKGRTVRVRLTPAQRAELLDDAQHYAGPAMADYWKDGRGVILSARATVRALTR